MAAERTRRRTAITIALVIGALIIAVLLVWAGVNLFAGDVLQCSTPNDDRTFTPVCP